MYKKRRTIPDDPLHPFFYHVYSDTLPLEISYRIIDDRKDLVTEDFPSTQVKGYKRRFIFEGYDNYTEFEKKNIQLVKNKFKEMYNIDLERIKTFGPRT